VQTIYQSEMALFYECMWSCAQTVLDTADIVREGMLRQLTCPDVISPLAGMQIYSLFVDIWAFINIVGLSTPFIWFWGIVKYRQVPNRSEWRTRASLVGLTTPVVSFALWLVGLLMAWRTGWPASMSDPTIHRITTVGAIWIPAVGLLSGVVGRPRLIPFIIPTSIGTVLFWFATTLP